MLDVLLVVTAGAFLLGFFVLVERGRGRISEAVFRRVAPLAFAIFIVSGSFMTLAWLMERHVLVLSPWKPLGVLATLVGVLSLVLSARFHAKSAARAALEVEAEAEAARVAAEEKVAALKNAKATELSSGNVAVAALPLTRAEARKQRLERLKAEMTPPKLKPSDWLRGGGTLFGLPGCIILAAGVGMLFMP